MAARITITQTAGIAALAAAILPAQDLADTEALSDTLAGSPLDTGQFPTVAADITIMAAHGIAATMDDTSLAHAHADTRDPSGTTTATSQVTYLATSLATNHLTSPVTNLPTSQDTSLA